MRCCGVVAGRLWSGGEWRLAGVAGGRVGVAMATTKNWQQQARKRPQEAIASDKRRKQALQAIASDVASDSQVLWAASLARAM